MKEEKTPVLVGVAQLTLRDADPRTAPEPLAMLSGLAGECAADAGLRSRALEQIDTIGIVDVIGWRPQNAPLLLGEALGARPRHQWITTIGGETPLPLVNQVASQIASGRSRMALVAGCNNFRTLKRAHREGVQLDWTLGGDGEPVTLGAFRRGNSDREASYGLVMPAEIYPILENAMRAHRGLDLETHRARLGALFARFTEVAARNPYAWFPVKRSADELITVTSDNRMVGYPYTKYLNAVLETDQAASVLMMSAEAARELEVPEDKWVYWRGGAHATEAVWYASERSDLTSCPALRASTTTALERARLSLDEIDFLDFYSCFPVAVEMACEMLGLDEDDPRGFTVTGGLPYAGGPGNNYTLHSLATMVERVRAKPGSKGLVTGNGWYLTKHSATVVSSLPAAQALPGPEVTQELRLPSVEGLILVDEASGKGQVETYTVLHDRDGAPTRGIVIGRLASGERFLSNTPTDRSLLEDLVASEAIGRSGRVTHQDGLNRFEPS